MSLNRLLAPRCASAFSAKNRAEAGNYIKEQAAEIIDKTASSVELSVDGFDVKLRAESRRQLLYVLCNCPYFRDGFNCKHVWAGILLCDTEIPYSLLPQGNSVEVFRESDLEEDLEKFRTSPPIENKRKVTRKNDHEVAPWKQIVGSVRNTYHRSPKKNLLSIASEPRKLFYVLEKPEPRQADAELQIRLVYSVPNAVGKWSAIKPFSLTFDDVFLLPDEADREILKTVVGTHSRGEFSFSNEKEIERFSVHPKFYNEVFSKLVKTERFGILKDENKKTMDNLVLLKWDGEVPWDLFFKSEWNADKLVIEPRLKRGEVETAAPKEAIHLPGGLLLLDDTLTRVKNENLLPWAAAINEEKLEVSERDIPSFLEQIYELPFAPTIDLPESLSWTSLSLSPKPCARFSSSDDITSQASTAEIFFKYDEEVVEPDEVSAAVVDKEKRKILLRDLDFESKCLEMLFGLGVKQAKSGIHFAVSFFPRELPLILEKLIQENWLVEMDERRLHLPGEVSFKVVSGVDWFDLKADISVNGQEVSLPQILKAARKGKNYLELEDGSLAFLSSDWLERYHALIELGEDEGDVFRYAQSQALLLEALLKQSDKAETDEKFRKTIQNFEKLGNPVPHNEGENFKGKLRDYQKEGLGWLTFLQEARLGGCLADDMGLGKTIQVLALLQKRKGQGTALVIVPKSLLFNWLDEAGKFAPDLKLKEYWGGNRQQGTQDFSSFDVIVTTYATIRNDILQLKDFEFDYVILDEAQAIKNSASQTAKASRLLKSRYRLALSGTPIENNLRELWSLFEFLNPGMLGHSTFFKQIASQSATEQGLDEATLDILRRVTRPFILRRTKTQVLKELPPKTEQFLHCELSESAQKEYEDLKRYYQLGLQEKIADVGIKKSAFFILEGLLRLRQFACHPGLLDPKRIGEESPKVSSLVEQIKELISEGHKILVFSQFTSFLSIIRKNLDSQNIRYEYLDGSTKDRKARVDSFNNNAEIPLFLLSLKAGGLGLNLTSADYVFLLDPWWNPAVEAQAVDRAHRMGQTKPVMIYKMITRNTIEEKILELQNKKRKLSSDVISGEESLLTNINLKDLELLFV